MSKHPMTDAKTYTVQIPISTNEFVTVSVVRSEFSEQLETELNELKRQIADCEFISVNLLSEYFETCGMQSRTVRGIQEFAKQKAAGQ